MQGETTLFVTLIKKREWRWLIYKVMCLCSTLNLTQQDFTIQTSNNFVRHSRCSRYKGHLSAVTCRKYSLKIIIRLTAPTCTLLCSNSTMRLFHPSLIRQSHRGEKWNTKKRPRDNPEKTHAERKANQTKWLLAKTTVPIKQQ